MIDRRLRFERLERRQVLSALGLAVDLYADVGGALGPPLTDETVAVGESFFVEIAVEDLREGAAGVAGLSVDLAWDAAILEEVDSPFAPTDPGSPLVNPALPLFRGGELDNAAGTVTALRGLTLPSMADGGHVLGLDGPERFALLHFQAEAAAEEMVFGLNIGQGGVGMVNGLPLGPGDLVIESQTVTVVGDQPALIEASTGTVQFGTDVAAYREGYPASPLVRPACPDGEQFVEITNAGGSPLTVFEVRIEAPDVSVDPLAADLVLAPGESQRFDLTYAPSVPALSDAATQTFDLPEGLVVVSNADNAPELAIRLKGASTFSSDVTYDGVVDFADLVTVADRLGQGVFSPDVDPTADVNGDGRIDLQDFGPMNVEFGRLLPELLPEV